MKVKSWGMEKKVQDSYTALGKSAKIILSGLEKLYFLGKCFHSCILLWLHSGSESVTSIGKK